MREGQAWTSWSEPLDTTGVGQTMLRLWLDGLAERLDLSELTPADSEKLLAVLPGASTLDAAICGAILWRADGSRTPEGTRGGGGRRGGRRP